jgi:hypothetical protein
MAMPTHGFGTDFIRKFKGKPQKEFNIRFNACIIRTVLLPTASRILALRSVYPEQQRGIQ